MNFGLTFLKTLQEAGYRMLTSKLLHSIKTIGRKEFLKFGFVLKKGILLF